MYLSKFGRANRVDYFSDEQVYNFETPHSRGFMQRGLELVTRAAQVGSTIEQNLHHTDLVIGACQVEGCQLLLIRGLKLVLGIRK